MPIEMPRGLPFSVDTWTPNSRIKRHHFLTHAHKDHSQGILTHASYPIYSTHITRALVLQYYPQLDLALFVEIEIGQSVVIEDSDGDFTVTALDANHCPGAVMFLFEGRFGNILHTGDCRLTPELLQCLPLKYVGKKDTEPRCPLDYVFLDCTFGRSHLKMPHKQSAVRQVINCIWKHPDAPTVYLTCDLLGQEEILVKVCQTFGCRIYIDKEKNPECYKALKLIVPEILAQDSSSRFQLFDGFPKLYERAEAKIAEAHANYQLEPLIIRPSAQWYVCEEGLLESEDKRKGRCDQAVRDIYGVWHVCYSMHSSREELEWALQLLAPKWVVSTTPSCRAMELNFVKKHCFGTRRSDDSLWRILDMSFEVTPADTPGASFRCLPTVESTAEHERESQSQTMVASTSCGDLFNLSSNNKRLSLTLFGRARHGLKDSTFQHENQVGPEDVDSSYKAVIEHISVEERVGQSTCRRSLMSEKREVEETESSYRRKESASLEKAENDEALEEKNGTDEERDCRLTTKRKSASMLTFGSSSKSLSENLRGFYRSMNVPVPQPLPSLVELMNANKYAKRRF